MATPGRRSVDTRAGGQFADWRRVVAPHAEKVAHLFADKVAGKLTMTTPFTRAKGIAGQAAVRRRKAAEAKTRAESAHAEHRGPLSLGAGRPRASCRHVRHLC